MNLAKLEHEEHLYMAFRFFDANDDGFIDHDELVTALEKVGACVVAEAGEAGVELGRLGPCDSGWRVPATAV